MNLRARLAGGRTMPLAALGYSAAVAAELALERVADRLVPSSDDQAPLLQDLTVLIKTFERPRVLRRLVASIRRFYSDLPVIVVDDSRDPERLAGVETIVMPYFSGLSAGRNEGLRHVGTRYVLILDDDFVFYRHTRLGPALAGMELHPEIDIMGGQVVNLPFYVRLPTSLEGPIYPTSASPVFPIGTSIGGFEVAAKVPNFFIAKRERLELVPWDPAVRLAEHADFFTQAVGVLTTVYNARLRCLHAKTPFAADYMVKRLELTDEESRRLAEKYDVGGV